MSDIVVDASALIAGLLQEPGHELVLRELLDSRMSAVNLGEVAAKFDERGIGEETIVEALDSFRIGIIPLDLELAYASGRLRRATRPHGLSLGDRVCVALAQRLSLPILTAERRWARMDLGVEIRVIR